MYTKYLLEFLRFLSMAITFFNILLFFFTENMSSTHDEALKDVGEGYKTCSKPISWHHLPSEILVMIMKKVSMSERAAMSRVCQTWRAIVSSEASRILNNIKQKRLVEESQLASLGLVDDNPDVNTCICIDIAYEKSPFSLSTKTRGIKACTHFVIFVRNLFVLSHKSYVVRDAEFRRYKCEFAIGRPSPFSCLLSNSLGTYAHVLCT